MHIIMGGTGHVGSAVASALLGQGERVAIVTRDAGHAANWQQKGADIIEADVDDVPSLRAAFRRGRRAFLLNPPADPSTDTDAVERRTVAHILEALADSGLEKVVAESTGGAQQGEQLGDLSVLWELEQGLRRQAIPAAINRAAYYMSNWDGMIDTINQTGKMPTMFPADVPIPMAAPADLGEAAARRMLSSVDDTASRYVEGPRVYTPAEVAKAFSDALGRPVEVEVTPRGEWEKAFRGMGFSEAAARSYARMTGVSLDSGFDRVDDPIRGTTTLERYIRELVRRTRDA